MTTPTRLAVAAATLAAVALIAINFLPKGGGVAAPVATPSPTPTPTPTASPKTLVDGSLAAGAYTATPFAQPGSDRCPEPPMPGCSDSITDDTIRFTFTIPNGWSGLGDWVTPTDVKYNAPAGTGVGFVRGGALFTNPCFKSPDNPTIAVGPSVNDFATALANHPLLDTTTPVDVTLAGYSGRYMDLQVPSDISTCDAYLPWERGIYAQGPGHRWHLWILDIQGVRVVVQAMDYAGTSPQHLAELEAIVKSIQIEP
jgi:hypothetical protein